MEAWKPIAFGMESGATEIRPRWDVPVRHWTLVGENLPEADCDLAMGFLYERYGGGNYWYWDSNVIPVWSPSDAPTTSTTAGGAIAGRTLYCAYVWSDGTLTTNTSQEATQVVAANNQATVTANQFPTGVTEARVYLGIASGTLTFGGTISSTGGTFTEPFSTVDVNSNSGQKVLSVAATTGFEAGQNVVIDEGSVGGGEENKVIDTVQAGVSLTMTTDLTYTHTLAQADEVYLDPGTGTAAPTTNTLKGIEIKLRLLNEPTATLIGGVYNITFNVEEMLP